MRLEISEHFFGRPPGLLLGSGGGLDVFLAFPLVGPEGKVIGIDMTPAMIERARAPPMTANFLYYEYQMDKHENWTSRKVWVQSGEQGERSLYETDSRTIAYWAE